MIKKNCLLVGIFFSLKAVSFTSSNNPYFTYPWVLKVFHAQSSALGLLISHDNLLIPGHMICKEPGCIKISFMFAEQYKLSFSKIYEIESYVVHPYYRYRGELGHDLAIIKLTESIMLPENDYLEVNMITYTPEELSSIKLFSICGWARNMPSLIKLEPELDRLLSTSYKDDSLSYKFKNNPLCGPGDSGAPLLYFSNGKSFIIGALSGLEDMEKLSFYSIAEILNFW